MVKSYVLLAAAIAILAHPLQSARADAEGFYHDKTITMIVSTGAGGGHDTYGRMFARHFGLHIAGTPPVVVQNMPGAGGIRAAAYLYKVAPRDGTVIASLQATALLTPLLSDKLVDYDPPRFTYIGNINQEYSTCASWHMAPIKSAKDLFKKEFVVGGTGAGTAMETYPHVLNNLFGMHIKIISGYKGGSDVLLAMERGEVEGRCGAGFGTYQAVKPDWIQGHKVTFLLQTSLTKDPKLPGVPWVMELVKTDEQKSILEVILAPRMIAIPVLSPPAVQDGQVEVLRSAFDATLKDPRFLKDAKEQHLDIDPMSGSAVTVFVNHLYQTPTAILHKASEALNSHQ